MTDLKDKNGDLQVDKNINDEDEDDDLNNDGSISNSNSNETSISNNEKDEQLLSSEENDYNVYDVTEAPSWPSGITKEWDHGKILFLRLLHFGPITAALIVFIIGLTTTILHATWWPISTPGGCLDLLLFLTWNYQVLSNMMRAAFYGGGYVPYGWHPENSSHWSQLQYCHRCNGFKAPRSHHCMKCNRCVLKMDHHCPWINNCVGHRNQVFFLRFLFFAVVGCSHSITIIGSCLWTTIKEIYFVEVKSYEIRRFRDEAEFHINSIYMFFSAVVSISLAFGVVAAVGFLLFVQLKIAFRNKTGIEDYICTKAKYRNGDFGFIYPYDLSWRRNWSEVFNNGKCVPKGNGVWWPVNAKCTQFSFSMEQLAQKKAKQEFLRRCREQGGFEEVKGWRKYYNCVTDFILCRN